MFITVIAGDQHDPTIQTGSCCGCHYVYGENTFIKGHLYFVTEFIIHAKKPDVAVSWGLV